MKIMAAPPGGIGFAPPRRDNTLARRCNAVIELVATLSLTVSLVIAATAVSLGNRALSQNDDTAGRISAQASIGVLLDQADSWLAPRELR
jgi:hypothetical protein